MRVEIVTIFPEYLAPLRVSLVGKAIENGVLDLRVHDLRDWTQDVHRTVDDTPYGGGPGMVMRPEPWGAALDDLVATQSSDGTDSTDNRPPRVIVPTPSGRPFTQRLAAEYAAEPWLLFACGRYEGLDGRVVEDARTRMRVDEVSLGDYVLAGGEVAALVVVEAVARLLPGVLGNAESARDDSFAGGEATGGLAGLLEGPTYTKPSVWRGREVPEVLRSGNHAMIARWRRDEALRRTARVRPDLIAALDPDRLDGQDRAVLSEVVGEAALQRFLSGPDSVAD